MAKMNTINNKAEELKIDPGASGDSFVQFDINGTGEFRIGVDDDDSDKFKVSYGSALGSNDCLAITNAGEVTKPLLPAFSASISSFIANATGDGTAYTVVFATETFDINSDFDGTSTFTAPVTGKYKLCSNILYKDIGASHNDAYIEIVTSNRTYRSLTCEPSVLDQSSTQLNPGQISVLCDMDASDTATIRVKVSGSTKTVDVGYSAGTDIQSIFCGYLAC